MLLVAAGADEEDEEDELNKLAQDMVWGAAAVVAGGGGAYGVGTMIGPWFVYGGCGGGTDRSGDGPGGGRGVFIWVSRWGIASTFLDSITGPGLTGVE